MRDKTVKTENDKWVIELEDGSIGESVTIGEIERQRDKDTITNRPYTYYVVTLGGGHRNEYLGTGETLTEAKEIARDNVYETLKSAGFF